jgi:cystathionine gamma-synthase
VADLPALAELCRARKVKTLVDATFATPLLLRPLEHGIDLVVHSASKYLGGHNDVLGGVLAGKRGLVSLVRDLRHVMGPVLDPHAALLIHRGMKTLSVRVAQQCRTAQALAEALDAHPRVRRVFYPGLASHPDYETARRVMQGGFGGVVTFEVDSDLEGTAGVVDACRVPKIAPSLGGVESLIEQPAIMSYFELSREERAGIVIPDSLVRYAVGIEDTDEIIADMVGALGR